MGEVSGAHRRPQTTTAADALVLVVLSALSNGRWFQEWNARTAAWDRVLVPVDAVGSYRLQGVWATEAGDLGRQFQMSSV